MFQIDILKKSYLLAMFYASYVLTNIEAWFMNIEGFIAVLS